MAAPSHSFRPLLLLPSLLLPLLPLLLPSAAAQGCRGNATLPLPAQTIFQLAPGSNFTFFENVASRANGDLLVTMAVPDPNVFLLRSPGSACPTLAPLFAVPGVNGTDGIAEVATRPDVFAVVAGNLSLGGDPANGVPGSWSVWEIDLSGDVGGGGGGGGAGNSSSSSATANANDDPVDCAAAPPAPPAVSARKIADLPAAPRLNGIAAVPGTAAVLVGDSELGVAFRLDTATGALAPAPALDLAAMRPAPGAGSIDDALGLNGMKVARRRDGGGGGGGGGGSSLDLYFTNAAARTVSRVAILPDGSGPVPGAEVELIASVPGAGWLDDLDVRDDGSLWVTTNSPTNAVLAIAPNAGNSTGAQSNFRSPVVALGGSRNSTTVAGDSAAVFGRGPAGSHMLYVVTGSGNEPAKVVRVDTSSC